MPPSQIVVQAGHAVFESALRHSKTLQHPHFVVLGFKNEQQLEKAYQQISSFDIKLYPFYEPDRDNEFTAFATESIFENKRHLFKKYNCLNNSFVGVST
ncbi:MAG: hypothetical protein EKK64_04385 [Neisseriaceae bacterium]|nr:MAG: hypothetical protein EKK64_04385 [Neisseriaceae bacterium]